MNTNRVLIVYSSRYGQTERIARRIARGLAAERVGADVIETRERIPGVLIHYDTVILAGAIYFSKHPRRLVRFALKHRGELSRVRTLFVSVSNAAISEAGRKAASEIVEEFRRETDLHFEEAFLVGGGTPYTKYNWFVKKLMLSIAKKHGRTVDPTRDYDNTDWPAVDAFAVKVAKSLPIPALRAIV